MTRRRELTSPLRLRGGRGGAFAEDGGGAPESTDAKVPGAPGDDGRFGQSTCRRPCRAKFRASTSSSGRRSKKKAEALCVEACSNFLKGRRPGAIPIPSRAASRSRVIFRQTRRRNRSNTNVSLLCYVRHQDEVLESLNYTATPGTLNGRVPLRPRPEVHRDLVRVDDAAQCTAHSGSRPPSSPSPPFDVQHAPSGRSRRERHKKIRQSSRSGPAPDRSAGPSAGYPPPRTRT